MTKSAFISILGIPNVGKSSLLNRLIGQKLAIISPKPQTTRTRITGILTQGEVQLVFTDTPGFHKPKNRLGENMMKAVRGSLDGIDCALFVAEAYGEVKPGEKQLLERLQTSGIKTVIALNKIDELADKSELLKAIDAYTRFIEPCAVVPVSAKSGENVDELKNELIKLAEQSPFYFPPDALTDQPERVLVSEIIREKMLRLLSHEVPHGVAVSVEKMREREDRELIDIEAVIYCEKATHKGIIIGKKGAMLKKISTYAREDIERFFSCKVNLQTWVKVKEDWRNNAGLIRNFGLDNEN